MVSHQETLQLLGDNADPESGKVSFNLQLNTRYVITLKGELNRVVVGCRAGPSGGINTQSRVEIRP